MAAITVPTACDAASHPAPWIAPELMLTVVDITEILCLMRHTDSGEYLQAPVVVAATSTGAGFGPDRIRELNSAATRVA